MVRASGANGAGPVALANRTILLGIEVFLADPAIFSLPKIAAMGAVLLGRPVAWAIVAIGAGPVVEAATHGFGCRDFCTPFIGSVCTVFC
jgi:hypothetical protein